MPGTWRHRVGMHTASGRELIRAHACCGIIGAMSCPVPRRHFWLSVFSHQRVEERATLTNQVRAAHIVLDAEQRGELPATAMPLQELGSTSRSPNRPELNEVWDLQRLARAVEYGLTSPDGFDPSQYLPRDMRGKYPDGAPEDPENMPRWRSGMYKALFRSLILAAALAGVYQAPLAELRKEADFEDYLEDISSERQDLIKKFTVFQAITTLEQDTRIFGSLDQWLLDHILSDGEARAAMAHSFDHGYGRGLICGKGEFGPVECYIEFSGGSHADAHLIIWDLVKILWITERLCRHVNGDNTDLSMCKSTLPKGIAPVVLFQHFSPMKIAGANLTGTLLTSNVPFDFKLLLGEIDIITHQPILYDTGRATPLHAKFFEHVLRHNLGLRFRTSSFQHNLEYDNFSLQCLLESLALFALDDIAGRDFFMNDDWRATDLVNGSEHLEDAENDRERGCSV